mmetsp:Transcript_66237/g.119219  ORF Transcript_66237/g.119219 Transcript_66237/m.119219 type:complete len:222 (-) Transcript_66237:42-707(-)
MASCSRGIFLAFSCLAVTASLELNQENWDEETAGKTLFLKFFAPSFGKCQVWKAPWDQLMSEYAGSESVLVADVDCTAGGASLCLAQGVDEEAYPTLKWGDASSLEDYLGGSDLVELQDFAKEHLKPLCSPANLHLCDATKKEQILALQALSSAELYNKVLSLEEKKEAAAKTFEHQVEELTAKYESLLKEKDDKLAAVRAQGLPLAKLVLASKQFHRPEL